MGTKNDISSRFIEAFERLLNENKITDRKDFALKIGISPSMVTEISKGRSAVGTTAIQNLVLTFGISANWLLTGQGDMFHNESATISTDPQKGIPYYDVDFLGGFAIQENDQTSIPAFNIISNICPRAEMWCNITGHSMEPTISQGDIIALRKCGIEDIQYGEMYAVVLDTFRTVKILRKASAPGKLKFVPINQTEFDEQEFDISRIRQVFEVVGCIRRFF